MVTLDTMLVQHRSLAFTIFFNASNILQHPDGAMVRALTSHQSGLGLIPVRCHMWDDVVVCSRPV